MCIDFRKLNTTTRKDHFLIHFIDEMLKRLAGKSFFCFLDGFSGYYQIVVAYKDQEKNNFHLSIWNLRLHTYAFWIVQNTLGTFQRCMMNSFSDLIEIALKFLWMTLLFMEILSINV